MVARQTAAEADVMAALKGQPNCISKLVTACMQVHLLNTVALS